MTSPVSSIPNLGPATEAAFAKAGITSAEQIRALGAHEAYRQWLQAGLAPHFIGYYVLHMGLQGRPWNDCKGEEKKTLRQRFDALVAETQSHGHAELNKALDFLGVVSRSG
jgi:DNA transformation protein and related proteins